MALWICDGCGCAYSVGADKCPHCGDTRYTPDYEQPEDGAPAATEPLATGSVIPANAAPVIEDGPAPLVVPAAKSSEAATASQPTTGKAST